MLHALLFSVLLADTVTSRSTAILATKIADALANESPASTAKIYIGTLPPRFPIPDALPKFTILGSVVETAAYASTPRRENSVVALELRASESSTVFYELPAGDKTAFARYQKQLLNHGWHELALRGPYLSASRHESQRFYCSPSGFLEMFSFESLPRTVAVAAIAGSNAGLWCKAFTMMPPAPSPPSFPSLRAPQETRLGVDPVGTTVVGSMTEALVTSKPIGVAARGLAMQLARQGWAADATAQSTTAYLQTFHRSKRGLQYRVTLALIRTQARRYTVELTETLLSAPPVPIP